MAADFGAGKLATFSLDSTDLSAYLSSVTLDDEADDIEEARLGNNAKIRVVGARSASISLEGFFHPTCDALLLSRAAGGSELAWQYDPQGSASGNRRLTGSARVGTYSVDTAGDGLGKWSAELVCTTTVSGATL